METVILVVSLINLISSFFVLAKFLDYWEELDLYLNLRDEQIIKRMKR